MNLEQMNIPKFTYNFFDFNLYRKFQNNSLLVIDKIYTLMQCAKLVNKMSAMLLIKIAEWPISTTTR